MNNSNLEKDLKEVEKSAYTIDWEASYKAFEKDKFTQPKDYFWLQCSVLILLALGLMAFFAYTLYYLIQPI
jgi:hypothetical protein